MLSALGPTIGHLAGLFWGITKERLPSIERVFIPRAGGNPYWGDGRSTPPCKLGCVNTTQGSDDQSEVEESQEEDIEFVEAREDATEALEPAKEPLHFIALAVKRLVVLPGFQAITLGRNHGDKAEIERQLPGFVVFVSAIHDQMQGRG